MSIGNVTKREIVEELARRTGRTQSEVRALIENFLDVVGQSLAEGRSIEIRGFGRFKLRARRPRMARNPRTGEAVPVAGGVRPVFEPSRELLARLEPEFDRALREAALLASAAAPEPVTRR